MICYKDMTFCIAVCANNNCHRKYTQTVIDAANKWWGSDEAPIAVSDLCRGCPYYEEVVTNVEL